MMEIALETRNLAKIYNGGTGLEVRALQPTNLAVEKGKFYSIIGRSGSGKSTLLHLLGALDRPTSGELFIGGENVYALSDKHRARLRRKRIGFVFQAYNLLLEHTVLENILMPMELDRRKPDEALLREVIASLGIERQLSQYPTQLSGGEQQRAAIARAPDILLADEPTGNLDPNTGDAVMALLKTTARRLNQTVIVVTHDYDVAALADVVVTLDNGSVTSVKENGRSA